MTINPVSVQDLMADWAVGTRKLEADVENALKPFEQETQRLAALKTEIERCVLDMKQERIEAAPHAYCIITSKGTYDWQKIAQDLRASEELIEKNTSVNWKAVAEGTGLVADPIKKRYYTPGKPTAQLKLMTPKEVEDGKK